MSDLGKPEIRLFPYQTLRDDSVFTFETASFIAFGRFMSISALFYFKYLKYFVNFNSYTNKYIDLCRAYVLYLI